jgi:hypothetical protein
MPTPGGDWLLAATGTDTRVTGQHWSCREATAHDTTAWVCRYGTALKPGQAPLLVTTGLLPTGSPVRIAASVIFHGGHLVTGRTTVNAIGD